MTQTVTDAQGTVHQFPDEATPDMIAKALGVQAPQQQTSQPTTLGYTGNRFIDGLIDLAKQGAVEGKMFADSAQTGQTDPTVETVLKAPSRSEMAYGTPTPEPPNAVARYAGNVAYAFGSNPAVGLMTPGYTAVGALGSQGASDLNKATGLNLPDWMVRLGGSALAGLGYGFAKNAMTSGTDAAVDHARDVVSRVKSGEGRLGEYQTLAQKAGDELEQVSANMPQLPPDHVLPVPTTQDLLNSPAGQFIPNTDGLRKMIAENKGAMFYGELQNLKDQAGAAGNSALYNALKADQRAALVGAHGPEASAAFDQANAARQALYLLRKSMDPSGLYNPLALTRKMAIGPGGETVANATPAMTALTDKASDLYDMVSPLVRANTPQPGVVSKLAKMGGAMAGGKLLGSPEAGGMVAGSLFARPDKFLNPLYQLPSSPLLSPTSPLLPALTTSLLNPQNQPMGGLLSPK